MRRYLLALLLLTAVCLEAPAQRLALKEYKEAMDSLRARVNRRGNVSIWFRLEQVTPHNGRLDFHFSNDLVSYPWREGDVEWFRKELADVAATPMEGVPLGAVYAHRQNLQSY